MHQVNPINKNPHLSVWFLPKLTLSLAGNYGFVLIDQIFQIGQLTPMIFYQAYSPFP